jgi:hypothetical protein
MKRNNVTGQLKNFVGIKQIDGCVLLDDNSLVAVLEILPIDFDKFSKRKQDDVLKEYKEWIKSLDYPVQVVVRNTNVDLSKQVDLILENTEREIKKKEDMREMLKLFDNFKEWLLKYIAKEKKVYRLYYLVIPLIDFKEVSLLKAAHKFKKEKEDILEDKKALLNMRVDENIELLEKTGVQAYRLNDSQLENLFSSYFQINNHQFHGDKHFYLDPDRWYTLWRKSLQKRG